MSGRATLECPHCGHTEYPLRHDYKSNCGGPVSWQYGTLKCEDCGTRIILFRCDKCRRELHRSDVS
jgi:predicted RNA-binding Zn-ribbon protein involved in translation (DUF1610 family)